MNYLANDVDKTMTTECPFCGGESGYYYKVIESRMLLMTWEGEGIEGSEPETVRGMKNRHCIDCDRDITKKVRSIRE